MGLRDALHRLNVGKLAAVEEEIQRDRLRADGRFYLRTGEREVILREAREVVAARRELRRARTLRRLR